MITGTHEGGDEAGFVERTEDDGIAFSPEQEAATFHGGARTARIAVARASRTITARAARALGPVPPPPAEPGSDPTSARRLTRDFVHLVEGTLVGEYVVERLLGAGGMGAVYGARHEQLGRRAAIKVISPALSDERAEVERFQQEALALARLSHPGIVGVLGVGTLPGDGRAYYVMEWLEGRSLGDQLRAGPVDRPNTLRILDQIARALGAAHAAGIVHRDIKPDNCWLQRVPGEAAPIVKVLDFGLAKWAAHRRTEETAVGTMFGTPAYMSPEQCRSARDVGPPTDVYALGCVAYELLCGRLPFAYDNVAELVAAHCAEPPPRAASLVPSITPSLDALLAGMLAKDPAARPTMAQVRAALAYEAHPRAPADPSPSPAPTLAPRWRPGALATIALVAVAGVVIAAGIVRPTTPRDDRASASRAHDDVAPTTTGPDVTIPPASVEAAASPPPVPSTTMPPVVVPTPFVATPKVPSTPVATTTVVTAPVAPVARAPVSTTPTSNAVLAPARVQRPTTVARPPTTAPRNPTTVDREGTLNPFAAKRGTW